MIALRHSPTLLNVDVDVDVDVVLYFQPLKFVRCDIGSVNHRLLVFDTARGLNPWHCLNGLWSLGKRMFNTLQAV